MLKALLILAALALPARSDVRPAGPIAAKLETEWTRLKVGKEYIDFAPRFYFAIEVEPLDEDDDGLRFVPVTVEEWHRFDEGDFYYDPMQG